MVPTSVNGYTSGSDDDDDDVYLIKKLQHGSGL
jgi:hypothetical protein